MFFKSVVAVALLAVSVTAQTSANSTVDPSTVDATIRAGWCSGQINTCGTLCSGSTNLNDCDVDALTFHCTCASNNSAPGLKYYTQTMPTFICEQVHTNCIKANENVAAAQKVCDQNEVANCGHLDPEKFVAPAASSSSSSTTAPSPTSAGAGTASTSASSSSSTGAAATMLAMGGEYGAAGMVAAGIAAFGMML